MTSNPTATAITRVGVRIRAVGETIVDQHVLQLPNGLLLDDLTLRIGLYDARNGQRLPVNGEDAFQAPMGSD